MAMYDLSHPIETGMPVYPGDPSVSVEAHATHGDEGVRVSSVAMGSHTGTHIDAPSHTETGRGDLDAFDVETFAFEAWLIDLEKNSRDSITTDDLEVVITESPLGSGSSAADVDCLLFRTGWDAHWGTERYFDHPYLTEAAAAWCADRDYHVGIDALNVDPTPTENATADEPSGFGAHHALLGADRLIVENLRGLDAVPKRFTLYAFPLAIAADGAPVRAVAST